MTSFTPGAFLKREHPMSHDVEVDRQIHEASRRAHSPNGFDL
jgi:hypothetical protein